MYNQNGWQQGNGGGLRELIDVALGALVGFWLARHVRVRHKILFVGALTIAVVGIIVNGKCDNDFYNAGCGYSPNSSLSILRTASAAQCSLWHSGATTGAWMTWLGLVAALLCLGRAHHVASRAIGDRPLIDPALRAAVLAKTGGRCCYCGRWPSLGNAICLDHLVPFSHGGPTTYGNLFPACRQCNERKGTATSGWVPGYLGDP